MTKTIFSMAGGNLTPCIEFPGGSTLQCDASGGLTTENSSRQH